MFETMMRRREIRRLMNRLETARLRKERAMEAFVNGKPASPVIAPSARWSRKVTEQPDAMHVAEAIQEVEQLEAEFENRRIEFEGLEI